MLEDQLLDIQIHSEDYLDIVENYQNTTIQTRKRKKKEQMGPRSVCGCGNTYSCSAALMLHIKNKHNGQIPQRTIGFTKSKKRKNKQNKESQSQLSELNESQSHYQLNQSLNNFIEENILGQTNSTISQQNINLTDNAELQSQAEGSIPDDNQSRKKSWYRRKYKEGGRQYVSKRIYLCGCCLCNFAFVEQLVIHIKKNHKGESPDGTIYGVKKQALFKYFNIVTAKPAINPNRKIYVFKCGCGKDYSCSSSLYYHIKTVHNGSEPYGTIGGAPTPKLQ